ncbi:uncharacterized protein FOMMEDRAFT_168951 [Fomitiporia mediterranea MF3/22]|uniref:uncharacterized protein n=1 Tax=Fomitiporia mediterranea (strain MF3/22) TaxID=694068 RepID=UPI00044084E6|nr:uncharacterized protein FOMMEDRAFT_168951 [Fomitiporia mediterranea MF3/22]EJD02512.1 hypothetical protein FOMMEDRAFT_168951 [Fomitiporia mediterranea MF3/22]
MNVIRSWNWERPTTLEKAPVPEFWPNAPRNHSDIESLLSTRDLDALKRSADAQSLHQGFALFSYGTTTLRMIPKATVRSGLQTIEE